MIRATRNQQERQALLAYLAGKVGSTPQALVGSMPFEVAAVYRAEQPVGAVLYSNFRGHSIEVTAAGEPGWLTRATIQAAFAYPFLQLGCWTVLTMINRNNAASRELNRRLGFTELCAIRTGPGKCDDIILYGMARDKCLWVSTVEPAAMRAVA